MADDVLDRLLAGIADARTRRLFREVWGRLPAHDRALLAATVRAVTADTGGPNFGQVSDVDEHLTVTVNLVGLARVTDDRAATGVIAHELAHVAGRHHLLMPIQGLRVLAGAAMDEREDLTIAAYLEDCAWFLAAVGWGFGAELRAFLAEYPRTHWPRWLAREAGTE